MHSLRGVAAQKGSGDPAQKGSGDPAQKGAIWYARKLPLAVSFDISFTLQFHRPSTCAMPNASAAVCGDAGIGGEGIALVLHNDPTGLLAGGCAGSGIGYAADASHFSSCGARIHNSLALQLVSHQNVSYPRRQGVHVGPNETTTVAWSDSNSVSLHLNGSNARAFAASVFPAGEDGARLTDGRTHHVRIQYSRPQVYVFTNRAATPAFVTSVDLPAIGAVDADGLSWVGFTASTGLASMDVDLLDFAFCQHVGCTAD